MTTALMQGGNLMIPPVKWMENNKPRLVDGLNHTLGEQDGLEEVKQEPRQTWGSLIKSRFVAWAAVFTSLRGASWATDKVIGKGAFGKFEDGFSKYVVCKPLRRPTHIEGKETTLFRVGKIASIDLFATIGSAALLFVASRIFSRKNPKIADSVAAAPPQPLVQEPPDDDRPISNTPSSRREVKRSDSYRSVIAGKKNDAPTTGLTI